ncbi:MAG: type VI secretion system baseplate subunit TssE [Bryobacteraceae bacterium]
MARWDSEKAVTQTVLDRLIDREPQSSSETTPARAQSVRQLKAGLRRDLEWLLNTRSTPEPAGDEYEHLSRSLFNYGLPDITSLHVHSSKDRQRLARMLETAIALFEPRLDRVKVIMLEPGATRVPVLRFQVEAMLKMDPAPELISFDTVLQLTSGEYQVRGEASA